MPSHQQHIPIFFALFLAFSPTINAPLQHRKKAIIYPTISVDPSGKGNSTTIQAAIDSVPSHSLTWTCIHIKKGVYREQVTIPFDKPFVYLKGEGKRKTYVVWDGHDSTASSATFTSLADNTFVTSITFVNSYNYPPNGNIPIRAAVAASVQGDKSAFYKCGFSGLQDTLWDVQGRHYFRHCTILGAIDFIFGAGQSHYEKCTILVEAGALNGGLGYITAQGRSNPQEPNGFVFKECNIVGNGKAFLGRPWRDYARVLFYSTSMSQVVVPLGWDSWLCVGREDRLTFAEHNCQGLGSNTSSRVTWERKLSKRMLDQLINISFIDDDGWVSRLPSNSLVA